MLTELTVRNFALIEELQIQLKPGYTVLTGETGAGKSIIVDALNAALGERITAEVVRGGSDSSLTEAVFDGGDAPAALAALVENGLAADGDETIIVSREIAPGGSRYRLNRRVSTLALVQEVGAHLADIHGQHQHQSLLHDGNHLRYLDEFGGKPHLRLLEDYRAVFAEFDRARSELRSLRTDEAERARRLDMVSFQVEEIDAAGLEAGEEEQLQQRRRVLQAGEKLLGALARAEALLAAGDEGALGAKDALQEAADTIAGVAGIDDRLKAAADELQETAYRAEAAVRALADYADGVELDPAQLEQVEMRLDVITGLKRKYGEGIGAILAFRDEAARERERLASSSERLAELEQQLGGLALRAGIAAEALSESRRELGHTLSEAVTGELDGLGMAGAAFDVEFEQATDDEGVVMPDDRRLRAGRDGVDRVRFLLCANPGEELKPLSRVASGGELSRLMLALKSLCARGSAVPTIVFDEIDVGIGGQTAHSVGEKLMALSQSAQVLCVTHLPQVAKFADHHYVVTKEVSGGRARIAVGELDQQQRVEEIARMYGGRDARAALDYARQALAEASRTREALPHQPQT